MKKTLQIITVQVFSTILLITFVLDVAIAANEFEQTKQLAEQGIASAQYNLGLMYSKGKGVSKSSTEAVKWYRKSAEQGNAKAQYNLGVKYYYGEGVSEDYIQAYKWWNLAAAQGSEDAKRSKNIVRKKMTPLQIEKSQELSSSFKPIKPTKASEPRKLESKSKRLSEEKERQAIERKRLAAAQRKKEEEQTRAATAMRRKELEDKLRVEQIARQENLERQQNLAQQRQAEEQELLAKMERDRNRRRAVSEFGKYQAIIREKVIRHWNRPSNAKSGLEAVVLVNLKPTGEVILTAVVNGSGNRIFDQSVEDAIFRASPLPIPNDGFLYGHFKEFLFEFKPDLSKY